MTTKQTISDLITWACTQRACAPALEWLRSLDGESSASDAWATCPRGDWLLWWYRRAAADEQRLNIRALVRVAHDVASRALALAVHRGYSDPRPGAALAFVRRRLRGEVVSAQDLRRAAADAADAAADAADAAAYAADAASYADDAATSDACSFACFSFSRAAAAAYAAADDAVYAAAAYAATADAYAAYAADAAAYRRWAAGRVRALLPCPGTTKG